MDQHYQPIRDLLSRVRARWRRLIFFHATIRAALAAAGVLAAGLFLATWTSRAPIALAGLGVVGLILTIGALLWGYRGARDVPSDARVARFVEERTASLDDRLVSAVDVATLRTEDDRPAFAASMVADAARASSSVDPADVVPSDILRRAGFQAAAAALVLIVVGVAGWRTARQSFDALSLALFPSRIALDVTPGDARVEAGNGLTIAAHLVGNRAPVVAQLLRTERPGDEGWQAAEMKSDADGRFILALSALGRSFRYRVVAAGVTSSTFSVS